MYGFPLSVISAVEAEWSNSCSGSITTRERTCGICLMEAELAPKFGLDVLQKIKFSCLYRESSCEPTSPYSRHYTDIKERK